MSAGDRTKKPTTGPDDPALRVVLAEPARKALDQHERTELAESLGNTSASTISRIVSALTFPTRLRSYRLARKIHRPLREVVAGHHPRYYQSTTKWGAGVIFGPRYRDYVFNFLVSFSGFLDKYVHFDFPTDLARQERVVVRPARATHEYLFFQLLLPEVAARPESFDLILSYQILTRPSLLFDFGRIEISAGRARAYEFWVRRYHDYEIPAETTSLWIKTWNAGKRNEYVIRSAVPFAVYKIAMTTTDDGVEVPAMVSESDLPHRPGPVIFFPAGGTHEEAPWTRTVEAIEASENQETAERA